MNKNYPLSYQSWDKREFKAIKKVLASGKLTMGKEVRRFEKKFAKKNNSKFAIMVNSGSSANLLIFASLLYTKQKKYKLKKNDEIIVPAVSWSTSYFPIHQMGFKMKFVDIDINTLNYDQEKLKKSINKKTRAILCVNILGNPNNYEKIKKIINKKNVFLIEDNCESLGAQFKKIKVGNFGIMSSFSTYFSHHISTIEGGLITTNDKEFYHILLSLRSHGWTRNLPDRNLITGIKSKDIIKESYKFILPGYNLRSSEIHAAAGIEQLKKLDVYLRKRKTNFQYFKNLLKNNKKIILQDEVERPSYFAISLVLKKKSNKIFEKLKKILHLLKIEYRPIVTGNFANSIVAKKYLNFAIAHKLTNANHIDKFGLMIGNDSRNLKYILKKLANKINYL